MKTNCPAHPDYFDLGEPVRHGKPVDHTRIPVREMDARCLWDQLQWVREEAEIGSRTGDDQYMVTLELEWNRRDLCSRCLLQLDHPQMTEIDRIRHESLVVKGKLRRIEGALGQQEGGQLRTTLNAILAEPDTRQ